MSDKLFRIEIIQPKFDELYRLYEGGFNRTDIKTDTATANKNQVVIKPKTLELIAKDIGNLDSGTNLVNFFTDCGVDGKLIEYPQTKWRMVYDVLLKLATSNKAKDRETLFKIIGNAVHPLMHDGNISSAENLFNKFNDYLRYDNGYIAFDEEENTYKVLFVPTKKEREEIMAEFHAELEEEDKKQQEFLCQPENKEKISLLRKTYQTLMGAVEVFCRNFSLLSHEDIVELNKYYLALDKVVWSIIDELKLGGNFDAYKKYPKPFTNLFSAEKELNGEISWDVIRREMSARFGEIETLYQRVNASDILAEPDKQKQLNNITLFLSELKEKTKEIKSEAGDELLSSSYKKQQEPLHIVIDEAKKIEEKLEAIATKNEDITITKNKKRIRLPHFQSTPWKDIIIRFLDERNVLIKGGNKNVTADYEGLGFSDDKSNKPNLAWVFLLGMAKNNGETKPIPSPISDNIKQKKRQVSDWLKKLFKNDTEPFYDFSETNTYKLKVVLIPPQTDNDDGESDKDQIGVRDYLKETMVSKYEPPNNKNER